MSKVNQVTSLLNKFGIDYEIVENNVHYQAPTSSLHECLPHTSIIFEHDNCINVYDAEECCLEIMSYDNTIAAAAKI